MGSKSMIWIAVGFLLVGIFLFNNLSSTNSGNVVSDPKNLRTCSLSIEGMYCQSCSYGVKAQIEELDGVVEASINHQTGIGVVTYDGSKVDAETIAAASTVYPATVISDEVKK